MKLRITFLIFALTIHLALGDKAASSISVPITSSYSAVKSSSGSYSAAAAPAANAKSDSVVLSPTYVAEEKSDTIEEKSDKITEKSDSYSAPAPAPAPSYQAAAPVSTGNLYYYYYPVAAYPIHETPSYANKKVGNSDYGSDSDLSPLVFLLVPLVLLLLALPFLGLIGANVNGGRGFRSADLDDKFGSFSELQDEIDLLLGKYISALEADQCMNRIVCELGVKARGISGKELFFSIVEWLAPDHTLLGKGRLSILKQAATKGYTMETCQKYLCNPPAIVTEGVNQETITNLKKN